MLDVVFPEAGVAGQYSVAMNYPQGCGRVKVPRSDVSNGLDVNVLLKRNAEWQVSGQLEDDVCGGACERTAGRRVLCGNHTF